MLKLMEMLGNEKIGYDFVIITKENTEIIAKKLTNKEGHILIAEPGHESSRDNVVDAHLSFYEQPFIKNGYLHVNRGSEKIGGGSRQTKWENDKDYLLRPIPLPSGDPFYNCCREFFEHLIIEPYKFSINFQGCVGRGLFAENGITFFIPKNMSLKPAFRHGLLFITDQININSERRNSTHLFITEAVIEKIISYAMEDFIKNEIFFKNVSAGVKADRFLEL